MNILFSKPFWGPFQELRRQRAGFLRTRDFLLRCYNGLVNRMPAIPWPGKGSFWNFRVKALKEPICVRQGSKDWAALNEVIFKREYSMVLDHDLGEVRTVVDLGSNIGLTIRLWLDQFPSARIVAVEPDPSNVETCRRNIHYSRHRAQVFLIETCVAGSERLVFFEPLRCTR